MRRWKHLFHSLVHRLVWHSREYYGLRHGESSGYPSGWNGSFE